MSGFLADEDLSPAILADKKMGHQPANVGALAADRDVKSLRILVKVGAPTARLLVGVGKQLEIAQSGNVGHGSLFSFKN
jgi:hypothetical protein